jgi:hypothetical protein
VIFLIKYEIRWFFLIKWLKNEKLDDFMEYAVQQIRWFQGIYTQLDDFNKFVNEEILLDDLSFFAIRWFQGIKN